MEAYKRVRHIITGFIYGFGSGWCIVENRYATAILLAAISAYLYWQAFKN